ncbi:MAG: YggT family protein [Proteobacteria bacterium]|nr:YggT family protein [Pseudomonadota bacterium]
MSQPIVMVLSFVIDLVLNMASLIVIASVIISMVGADPYNPIVQTIVKLTEPLFRPFRPLNAKLNLPIDLAPLIVLLIITTLQRGVVPAIKLALIQP